MKKTLFTFILCALLVAGATLQTKIADCQKENVIDVALLDGKTFSYSVKTDDRLTYYILVDGNSCIGNICGDRAVYIKNGAIWTK